MNLIAAIKSGRPIRRKDRATWNRSRPELGGMETTNYITDPSQDQWFDPKFYLEVVGICKDDLLSGQWEIKEPSVPVTRRMFGVAFRQALLSASYLGSGDFEDAIARNLGLENE